MRPTRAAAACVLCLGLWPGCSPSYHREDADREVYRILEKVRQRQLGLRALFDIEPSADTPLAALERLRASRALSANGPGPPAEPAAEPPPTEALPPQEDAVRLTLADALELAARYSRDYQTEKEGVYLAALALTLERHRWKPSFLATFTGTVTKDKSAKIQTPQYTEASGKAKRAAESLSPETDFEDARTRTRTPSRFAKTRALQTEVGVKQLLATGGEMTVKLTTDLARYTTQEPRETIGSVLAAEVVQPLLRGGGRLVARENLTQAERDTVYAVRSFARFRRTFAYTVTSEYFRVLQQRDAVINAWDNYQRLVQAHNRAAFFADAGRRPEFEAQQALQDELRARDSWQRAVRQYQEQLDSFKITLGLPTQAAIVLDPAEILRLREAGLGETRLTLEEAMDIALERRLDLLNTRDQVEDSERLVAIARNGLAPDLALRLGVSVASRERTRQVPVINEDGVQTGTTTVADRRRPLRFSMHRATYTAGLEGELPLDRKAERNAYRQSLIALEQARRSAGETTDQVTLSVRQAWRNLQEAAESYRIQRASVDLARQRVEATNDLFQRGDLAAREILEANEALVNAQNALTRALVDHHLARLGLWRDAELLRVDERGLWQDPAHAR